MPAARIHAGLIGLCVLALGASPERAAADGGSDNPAGQINQVTPATRSRDSVDPRLLGPPTRRPGEDTRFRQRPRPPAPYNPGPGFNRVHMTGDNPAGRVVKWFHNPRTGVVVRVEEDGGRYNGRRTVFRGAEAQRALRELQREQTRPPQTVIR